MACRGFAAARRGSLQRALGSTLGGGPRCMMMMSGRVAASHAGSRFWQQVLIAMSVARMPHGETRTTMQRCDPVMIVPLRGRARWLRPSGMALHSRRYGALSPSSSSAHKWSALINAASFASRHCFMFGKSDEMSTVDPCARVRTYGPTHARAVPTLTLPWSSMERCAQSLGADPIPRPREQLDGAPEAERKQLWGM